MADDGTTTNTAPPKRGVSRRSLLKWTGIGVGTLAPGEDADPPDLVDVRATRTAAAEHAVDRLREKFGEAAVIRGLMLDDAGKVPKAPKA